MRKRTDNIPLVYDRPDPWLYLPGAGCPETGDGGGPKPPRPRKERFMMLRRLLGRRS